MIALVSTGCGLISMKVQWVAPAVGDGLAEPHRVAHVGHPVVGIEQRRGTGILDCADRPGCVGSLGARPANASRNSGRMGSIIAWWDATSTFTRRANVFCALPRR